MPIDVSTSADDSLDEHPRRTVVMDDPYNDWSRDIVEFRLTYQGLLPSAGNNNPQVKHKHAIRKVFHKQLKRLWDITPSLQRMLSVPATVVSVNRTDWKTRREALPERFKCGDYRLLPLVTEDLGLMCSLDILFLRPGRAGELIKSGDIDNRLKTLFDALRIPHDGNETGHQTPTADEDPLYCLLEDDVLISRVTVETDTLLQPTRDDGAFDTNDARLVITVKLKPTDGSVFSTAAFL